MNITKTTERKPPRIVVHGAPGVGKTTLGAAAPSPIFIRTEDGQEGMGIDAFDLAVTWEAVMASLTHLAKETHTYQTVVIDALDGIERLIWSHVCQQEGVTSLEKIPYGKGYAFAIDQWSRLFAGLSYLREKRTMTCVLLCHSIVKRHASPDMPEFDRYQMRLHDKAQGLVCEWADLIGFARSEILTKETEAGKTQGMGTGRRVLCCYDSPTFVGKNRYGITQSLPLTWAALSAALQPKAATPVAVTTKA